MKNRLFPFAIKSIALISIANVMLIATLFWIVIDHSFVVIPRSINLPEAEAVNVCTMHEGYAYIIFVTRDKQIFLGPGMGRSRRELLERIADHFNITPTDVQREQFEQTPFIGGDMRDLPGKINFASLQNQAGISCEESDNQLAELIQVIRDTDSRSRFRLYADKELPYSFLKKVIDALQRCGVNRFEISAVLAE